MTICIYNGDDWKAVHLTYNNNNNNNNNNNICYIKGGTLGSSIKSSLIGVVVSISDISECEFKLFCVSIDLVSSIILNKSCFLSDSSKNSLQLEIVSCLVLCSEDLVTGILFLDLIIGLA